MVSMEKRINLGWDEFCSSSLHSLAERLLGLLVCRQNRITCSIGLMGVWDPGGLSRIGSWWIFKEIARESPSGTYDFVVNTGQLALKKQLSRTC